MAAMLFVIDYGYDIHKIAPNTVIYKVIEGGQEVEITG